MLDYDDLLLYWAELMADPAAAAQHRRRASTTCSSTSTRTPTACRRAILAALKPDGRGRHRRRRRRAGDLRLPRRRGAQHPRLPGAVRAAGARSSPSSATTARRSPILAAANAVIGEARERYAKDALDRPPLRGEARSSSPSLDEAAQADCVCAEVLAAREAGVALKAQAVLFRAAHHSGPLEVELARRNIPFVKFGGLKFLEAAHVKDLLARAAPRREPARPPGRASACCSCCPASARPPPRRCSPTSTAGGPDRRCVPPKRAADDWPAFAALLRRPPPRRDRLAGRGRGRRRSGTSRTSPACTRTPPSAAATSPSSARIAAGFASRTAFLTELTLDPPQATSDLAGPPLRDEDYLILSTIHSAKGQEWKSVHRPELRRRLHPLRPRHRHPGRDRRGAPAASTSR